MSSVRYCRRGKKNKGKLIIPEPIDWSMVPLDAWPVYWDAKERSVTEGIKGQCTILSTVAAPDIVTLDIQTTNSDSTQHLCPVCGSVDTIVYLPTRLGICFECKRDWRV